MRTTTRSSELLALLLLAGCMTHGRPSSGLLEIRPESLEHKAAQTRFFETDDDRELLSASAAVLQDLGFHIEESVRDLGLMRAAKERSAREQGQGIARALTLIFTFGHAMIPIDLHQKICASLVASPANRETTRFEVRITFYRVVWKGDGQSGDQYLPPGLQRMEMIRDPEIYRQFFAKLSKAVFLEAYTL